MPGFSIPSASGRRVDLLNPVDVDPHELIRASSLTRMSSSVSPPPAHESSTSPPSAVSPLPTPSGRGSSKRTYMCQECLKIFSTSGHLTRHSKVHTGEKNHICPYPECQRRCSRRDNLLQHYTMHLTKEERDLPTTYVREALAAMQVRMGTYVHPYPRGSGGAAALAASAAKVGAPPPPPPPQHAQTMPTLSSAARQYPEPTTYSTTEHPPPPRFIPLTMSPTPLKPMEIVPDDMYRPPSMRRTSSSSSSESTLGPITPPTPFAPPISRKEYLPPATEDRRFQVSSLRGTL